MVPLLLALALSAPASDLTPQTLWELWPQERFVSTVAPCLRPEQLEAELRRLAAKYPDQIELEEIGRSVQGRPIHMVTLGTGPRKVLLWSQMHGDEPSATPALLDMADWLLEAPEDPRRRTILEGTTLLMIPMLNPDGAEVYERRNAQGIDINRDALALATPEARILKRVRDQHEPMLGFNLHDQNRRTSVGDTGKLAINAVLAVAGDKENTLTPGRARAKRACAAIVEALEPFVPGGIARYDEDWSPRAFGDNLTAWGTPVVLIESGGLPPGFGFPVQTRLNFVAILTVLEGLVENDLADYDPEVYEKLERNESDLWSDVAVRGARLLQPGLAPYRADLSFDLLEDDRQMAGCDHSGWVPSRIVEVGDSRFIRASREIDASGKLVMPTLAVQVDGFRAHRWLDREALERLAALGVGTVHWKVEDRKARAAAAHARGLAGPGHPRFVVTGRETALPRLRGVPPLPEAATLGSVLEALGVRAGSAEEALDVIERFWRSEPALPTSPPLQYRAPASFLIVTPGPQQSLDPSSARLESVWIDGVEVGGVASR